MEVLEGRRRAALGGPASEQRLRKSDQISFAPQGSEKAD
jgi:hypothetical protein